jgi:LAS superfamily LD-carboxypeptidase LdcB
MNRVIAYSKIVAARYGINEIKQEHLPFLNSVERTKAYAAIKYQRALADASSLTFTAAHRPFIMPNRPILLERRNKLGMSIAVEHSWEITGNVSTEVSVKCIRKRVKVGNQYIYRFVTGGSAMAISYRVPVKSEVPPTGKPTSEAQAKAAKYVSDQQSTQQTRAYYSAAGYKNGQPIEVTLVDIAPGKGLVPDAALAWNAMKAAAKDDIGVEFGVNYAFRTMEQQRALYNGGSKAAKPGYSSHQQGISVDISGVHGYSTNQYKWLSEHASAFGFVDDARKQGEYWHWTFTGSSTAPAESEHESVGKDADPGAPELVASTSDDDTEQAAPDVKTNASSGVTTASTSDAKKTAAKDVTSTPTQATQNPVQQATTSPPKPA